GRNDRRPAKSGVIRRRTASRGISARPPRPFVAARRVRSLCLLRTRRSRRGETRDLPASRRPLRRGLVVPHLSGLVAYRTGNVGIGHALTERALPLRPENASAAHGLSHALFELGEPESGRAFLSSWLNRHEQASFLHGH